MDFCYKRVTSSTRYTRCILRLQVGEITPLSYQDRSWCWTKLCAVNKKLKVDTLSKGPRIRQQRAIIKSDLIIFGALAAYLNHHGARYHGIEPLYITIHLLLSFFFSIGFL